MSPKGSNVEQFRPDDHPGEGIYFTLNDVRKIVSEFLGPDLTDVTCKMLQDGDPIAVGPDSGAFEVRSVPAGTGLYQAFAKGDVPGHD